MADEVDLMEEAITLEDLFPKPPEPKPKPEPKFGKLPKAEFPEALVAQLHVPTPEFLWEQLPEEPGRGYELFLVYLELGVTRTQEKARDKWLDEHPDKKIARQTLAKYCSRWRWPQRVKAFDRNQMVMRRKLFESELAEARHIAVMSIAEVTRKVVTVAQGEMPMVIDKNGKETPIQVRTIDMLKAADAIRDVVGLKAPDQRYVVHTKSTDGEKKALDYSQLSREELEHLRNLHKKLQGKAEAEAKIIDAEHEPVKEDG